MPFASNLPSWLATRLDSAQTGRPMLAGQRGRLAAARRAVPVRLLRTSGLNEHGNSMREEWAPLLGVRSRILGCYLVGSVDFDLAEAAGIFHRTRKSSSLAGVFQDTA